MQEKHNDATVNRPQGERVLDAPQVMIDLHAYTSQIKSEKAWQESDRNAITVFKTGAMHIVLIAMHQGAELLPQVSESVVCVQVLEGFVNFITNGATNEIKAGQIITLHENIEYNIVAAEDSTFLLTTTGFEKKTDLN